MGPMSSPEVAPRRWNVVLRRWPTAVAVGMTVLLSGGSGAEEVASLAQVLPLLPLLYLVVAKLGRPRASWPVLVILLGGYTLLRALDLVAPAAVVTVLALAVLAWGAFDGAFSERAFRAQALGMAGFGAIALAGLIVEPDVSRYVVAAGWLFHGIWDFVHLRKRAVVSGSYAEWCGVVDVLIAADLIFLA